MTRDERHLSPSPIHLALPVHLSPFILSFCSSTRARITVFQNRYNNNIYNITVITANRVCVLQKLVQSASLYSDCKKKTKKQKKQQTVLVMFRKEKG